MLSQDVQLRTLQLVEALARNASVPIGGPLDGDASVRTLQIVEWIARKRGILPYPPGMPEEEPSVATIIKSIGTSGRDYSSITSWEADLDNGASYSSGDTAVGECYNDSVFDEQVTINGGGTVGLARRRLTVAVGQEHDGTAGTGARIVYTGSTNRTLNVTINDTDIWLLEIDEGSRAGGAGEALFTSGSGQCNRLLIHDKSVASTSRGIYTDDNQLDITNTIVYNITSTSSGTHAAHGITGQNSFDLFNCTIYKVTNDNGTGGAVGVNAALAHCQNVIAMGTGGTSSGDKLDFHNPGVNELYCMSSDGTADDGGGAGNLVDKVAADQFVSTVPGMEDLHLKAGADAIDAGTDLGTSPTGVNVDINGRDRDAEGDVWDIGAHEYVALGGGLSIPIAMYYYKQLMGVN